MLVPSAFARDAFLHEGFEARKILQLPFGADTRRFRPAADGAAHPFRVLYVGQISFQKGIPYLLNAWQQLAWRDAELCMIGRADADIQPLLNKYAHIDSIKWIGHTPQPVVRYQQADVFAFPSLQEGSALVIYEALACGLPRHYHDAELRLGRTQWRRGFHRAHPRC